MKKIIFIFFILVSKQLIAQNDRVSDFNYLNWLQTFNTISFNDKWSLHLEYQWRRDQGLKNWQQSLFRTGINYKLNDLTKAKEAWQKSLKEQKDKDEIEQIERVKEKLRQLRR